MGGKSGGNKVIPEFTGLQVNTAVQVLPVAIIYGAPRININLIYFNGFRVSQQKTGGGGKGILGGGKGGASQTVYNATLIMAAGEGVLGQPMIIYQDQGVYIPSNWPTNGAFWFEGDDTQLPWDVVVNTWPADARAYRDTAYYALFDAQLDSSATVPQIGLVLPGHFSGTSPLNDTTLTITTGQYDQNGRPISFIGDIQLNHVDADPAECIFDFMTNETYGAGFPQNLINQAGMFTTVNGFIPTVGDNTLSTYCQAVGLAWSLVLNNVESGNTTLDRLCKNLSVAPVWDGALLNFIPYYDQYCGDNPGWSPDAGIAKKYFNPYIASIIFITQDQILQAEEQTDDPITFSRVDPWKIFNVKRIDFRDRLNFFNDVPAEAKDEPLAELYQERVDNIGLATEFSYSAYAQKSVNIQLRRSTAIRRTFKWRMSPLWAWLTPMELVNIPDPANLNNFICVRITDVEDDEDDIVTFTAEEFPLGAMAPTSLPMSPTTPPNQNPTNAPAASVFPPVIMEPTTAMLTATGFAVPQIIIGAAGGFAINQPDGLWGGAFIWVSLDNISYQLIGTLNGASIMGTTTSAILAYGGSNPDLTDTLSVNLEMSNGKLTNFPAVSASGGASLCIVKDLSSFELIAYENATLTSTNNYNLTRLYRGMYGTTPRQFGAGAQFLFLGTLGNYFETALPSQYVGKNFFVKLQSFNAYNTWTQDLDTCEAYQYFTTGPTPVFTQPVTKGARHGDSTFANQVSRNIRQRGLQ